MIEPPPQVIEWNYIWRKWLNLFYEEIRLNQNLDRYYNTLALMVADVANIKSGDVILLKERVSGDGVTTTWDAVDATTVTEDEFSIVTGSTTVSFQLRINSDENNVEAFGAGPTIAGATNVLAIQAAMDGVPIGSDLIFSNTYPLSGSATFLLTLSRNVNLIGKGVRRADLRADSVGATTSILELNISDNGGFSDVRNWKCANLTIRFNGGGKHTIYYNTDGFAFRTSQITNCWLTKGAHADGACFQVGEFGQAGIGWAHSTVSHTTLNGPIAGRFSDANLFTKNFSLGLDTAYVLELDEGVRNNSIIDNTIVSRDGALWVKDGDNIRFQNNQVEQFQASGANQAAVSASIRVEGSARESINVVIEDNNFGGGTNVDHSVYLDNAQHCIIGKNNFVACGSIIAAGSFVTSTEYRINTIGTTDFTAVGAASNTVGLVFTATGAGTGTGDVNPSSSGDIHATANSKYNTYKFDNSVVTQTSNTRTDDIFKAKIINLSGYNIQMPLDVTMSNSWVQTGHFYPSQEGLVRLTGTMDSGTTTGGTLMATFPAGSRSTRSVDYIPVKGNISAIPAGDYLIVTASNGQMTVGTLASSATVYFDGYQTEIASLDF